MQTLPQSRVYASKKATSKRPASPLSKGDLEEEDDDCPLVSATFSNKRARVDKPTAPARTQKPAYARRTGKPIGRVVDNEESDEDESGRKQAADLRRREEQAEPEEQAQQEAQQEQGQEERRLYEQRQVQLRQEEQRQEEQRPEELRRQAEREQQRQDELRRKQQRQEEDMEDRLRRDEQIQEEQRQQQEQRQRVGQQQQLQQPPVVSLKPSFRDLELALHFAEALEISGMFSLEHLITEVRFRFCLSERMSLSKFSTRLHEVILIRADVLKKDDQDNGDAQETQAQTRELCRGELREAADTVCIIKRALMPLQTSRHPDKSSHLD